MEPIYRTVHLKFSDEELAIIDAWKASKRIRTRSEAIRQAVRLGMGDTSAQEPEDDLQRIVREEVARAVAKALKAR